MVEAVRAPQPVSGHVVEMLGDIGAPTLQQDVAHLTQRLATLTGAQPAFLRVPGVVASPAILEAMLSRDPHAREALLLLDDLDLALLGIGPARWSGRSARRQLLHPGAVRRGRPCGRRRPGLPRFLDADGGPVRTALDDLVVGVTLDQFRARPHPLGGVGRQGQVPDPARRARRRLDRPPRHRRGHGRAPAGGAAAVGISERRAARSARPPPSTGAGPPGRVRPRRRTRCG